MSFSSWIPTFVSSTASSLFASISVPSQTPLVPPSLPQDILLEDESGSDDSPPEDTLFRKSFDPVVAPVTKEKHALKVRFEEPSVAVSPPIPSISVPSSPPKPPAPPPSISLPSQDSEDLEDDSPPPFPLLNSHQRSSAPSTSSTPSLSVLPPPPSFSITPPTSLRSIDDEDEPSSSASLAAGLGNGGGGAKNSLATPTTTTKVIKARGKVGLSPGHSPLDWARVKSSGRYDGRSLKGDIDHFPVRVTPSLLKEHNGRNGIDAWSAYQGRVYNITPYLKFHPGGEKELMRSAGRDGTKLFMATHAWVNMDMMMDACLVGMMVPE